MRSGDRKLMGENTNGRLSTSLDRLTVALMTAAALTTGLTH
jgi:hypothetical protein